LRLHTHPKLLAHQCGAHIRCMNQFICSGWAYGTIGNVGVYIVMVCQWTDHILARNPLLEVQADLS
jgi:hypothetical protein